MVSVNVSQLLLLGLGAVREFDFSEPIPDLEGELHLHGPVSGHARMLRTSEGILVHSEHHASVVLECARCLEDAPTEIEGDFDEEFLPSIDLRTGLPADIAAAPDQLLIDAHHEIVLDEVLRQNILTNLPLRALCDPKCPGLCSTCGERLDTLHTAHPDREPDEQPIETPASPFARLAVLLKADPER
ncbi:MAG: DUF177 domain-containing protein [Chloroflexi bacterium]|nr:DUF177 domain-containing protein [Chloroflexota bacterium]